LVFFQPLWALRRPTNDYPNPLRFFWARIHWWVGRVAIILAYVQIPIGMIIFGAKFGYIVLYVCGVAVAIAIYAITQFYYDWSHTTFGKQVQTSDTERLNHPPAAGHEERDTHTGEHQVTVIHQGRGGQALTPFDTES